MQCLKCLEDKLNQYGQYLERLDEEAEPSYEGYSHIGFALADLTEEADKIFGGIIFTEMFGSSINVVCSVFFLLGLLGVHGDAVTPTRGLLCICFVAYSTFFITKMYDFQKCGQNIASAYSDIRYGSQTCSMWYGVVIFNKP